ncbi:MAG TPA: hypothetical protein VFU36_17005 [Jatrophihabitans sp.]|nr:hypothetical protein [Jatrophihabitans sp.]
MPRSIPTLPRAVSVARAALAVGLLVRPGRVATLVSVGARCPAPWLIRLLGGRMLAQSGVELAGDSRRLVRLGAGVDALHSASMLAAALRWPRYRRVALASAGIAAASAVAAFAGTARAGGAG